MAGVADKARFYLERAVPQLREFEEKSIFSPEEIKSLVRKRTDHEHLVLSPGSKPRDWLAYVRWERSLESLRSKRCKRLAVKSSSRTAGEGRIFTILERAVQKHPGDMDLWREYLGYAKEVKASKRYRKIMTRALRLHPARPDLWVMAGRRAASHGDMQASRGFFMRGARFCTRDPVVWLEYARCELEWLAKLERRKGAKGGVAKAISEQAQHSDDEMQLGGDDEEDDEPELDEDGNQLVLPNPDRAGAKAEKVFDDDASKTLKKSNPALDGAIPLAIFDIACKQPFFNASVAEEFFDLYAIHSTVSSRPRLLQHILDAMQNSYPGHPSTCYCFIRQPLVGVDTNTAEYPKALREALARLRPSLTATTNKPQLADKLASWLEPILAVDDLDSGIKTVLEHTIRTLPKP